MPKEKVYEASEMAALHQEVLKFDKGYKTIVGEKERRFPAVKNSGLRLRGCWSAIRMSLFSTIRYRRWIRKPI